MPTKVGRRVSPPPWTITEHHEKPVVVSTRVQRHVAGLPINRRGDVSMDVSLRVALDRCHASTISKRAAGLKPAAHIPIIVGPKRLGVEKLRPPLRQVVVFVHHGVPNGDLEAVPIRAAGSNVALLDNDGTERIG